MTWDALWEAWGGLGTILGDLGTLLGPLGSVLGLLEAVSWQYLATIQFQKKTRIDLGSILRPKRLPKRVQNGAQNGAKSNAKINMKKEGFEDPLGSVLGQSWVVLGSILGSKIIKCHLFLLGFVKINVFEGYKA